MVLKPVSERLNTVGGNSSATVLTPAFAGGPATPTGTETSLLGEILLLIGP